MQEPENRTCNPLLPMPGQAGQRSNRVWRVDVDIADFLIGKDLLNQGFNRPAFHHISFEHHSARGVGKSIQADGTDAAW